MDARRFTLTSHRPIESRSGPIRAARPPPRQRNGQIRSTAPGRHPGCDDPVPRSGAGVDYAAVPHRRTARRHAKHVRCHRRRRSVTSRIRGNVSAISLAPKIVVVGDDKQVSPAAVGIDQQELRDLANMYLRDDPHRASWEDPKQSFFDEAVKRFGSRLTLIEHRRCVPEIIGFSQPDRLRTGEHTPSASAAVRLRSPGANQDGSGRRGLPKRKDEQDQPTRGRCDYSASHSMPFGLTLQRKDDGDHFARGARPGVAIDKMR